MITVKQIKRKKCKSDKGCHGVAEKKLGKDEATKETIGVDAKAKSRQKTKDPATLWPLLLYFGGDVGVVKLK